MSECEECVDGTGDWVVQILVNSDTSSAYWNIDNEFDPCVRGCAEDYAYLITHGEYPYRAEHVRIARIVPVEGTTTQGVTP